MWIITNVQVLEAHERAYRKGDSMETVVADIKCPNGGGSNVSWEGRELVGGEIKDSESQGPLVDVRYLNEFVIAEVELIETWQLKEAMWDSNQFIVLQIKLNYLKREGRGGREQGKREGARKNGWREGVKGREKGGKKGGGQDKGREEGKGREGKGRKGEGKGGREWEGERREREGARRKGGRERRGGREEGKRGPGQRREGGREEEEGGGQDKGREGGREGRERRGRDHLMSITLTIYMIFNVIKAI